jgi:tetratricopeptide (TPR) repeat protein
LLVSVGVAGLLGSLPLFAQTRAPDAPASRAQAGERSKARPGQPQAGEKSAAPGAPDYSKAPFFYQKILTDIVFADDGAYTYHTVVTAKIQAASAVRSFSVLRFPYASATGTVDIVYVRVRKPDGTLVATPLDTAQEIPAEITREAPFYSDLREKQVPVKGLEAGDALEYASRGAVQKPLVPGQFWYEYNFTKDAIVLDQELRISVPKNRKVIVGSGTLGPTMEVKAGERIYTWKTSHLKESTEDALSRARKMLAAPPADVQLTTFRDWAEVGQWFRGLAAPRDVPTPQIRAEAAALTKGLESGEAKVRAIYDYVSLKFRYVGIAFGIGRYQPHAAAEVMANAYGDCKDQETLLAALLAAEGLQAYPALINTSHKIDPSVPSPGQFDHVIAAVPQGSGYEWLDTTTGVAPPGFLLANLRGKEALVIPDHGPAQLVKTPANPPFKTFETFQANAKLSNAGTLESQMETDAQGDSGILMRLAFRDTPQAQWTQLLQEISYRLGFGGTVSDVTASPVESTDPTLRVSYHYTRKNYSDWSEKEVALPLPQFFLPAAGGAEGEATEPVVLGAPGSIDDLARVELPAGYTPSLPPPVNVADDFAEYHASYSFAKGVLSAERRLTIKTDKVPAGQQDDYKKFVKVVNDDASRLVPLEKAGAATGYQPSAEAQSLYAQGATAWRQGDMAGAADSFRKAVAKDPKYGLAWTWLGAAHVAMGDVDEGLNEMKKAIAVDPHEAQSYSELAIAQLRIEGPEASLKTWRQLEKIDPGDADAPKRVGLILLALKRYSEALPELQTAVKKDPTDAYLYARLAVAELKLNHAAKALGDFQEGIRLNPSSDYLNDAAYSLADANQYLDIDLGYAQKAVAEIEKTTSSLSVHSPEYTGEREMTALSAYWDTLGWVHFRMGHLEEAEKYLLAAWQITQSADTAGHLGQVYEKEGRRRDAEEYYADALAAPKQRVLLPFQTVESEKARTAALPDRGTPTARQRLVALLKSDSRADEAVERARDRLGQLRTIRLPKLAKSAEADYVVLLTPGAKGGAAEFIRGDETLKKASARLASAKFPQTFPDAGPEKIVRRGLLECEAVLPSCDFIFYPVVRAVPLP